MKKLVLFLLFFIGTLILCSQETTVQNTTICWDVSASMNQRDLEKDFSVLDKVFQRNGNQDVQLLLFGINVEEKKYTIDDGDWSQLREDLKNVKYDGGTIYKTLNDKVANQNVYVFTDGRKTLSKDILTLQGKSFIVNTSANRDDKFLERTALLNKSRLMDFATMLPENVAKLQQQNTPRVNEKAQVKGTVYIDNKPSSGAKVTIKGISDSFLTDASGGFSIPAEIGDTLIVTSRKSRTIKTLPVETMSHISVFMASNAVALDEVVVVEEKLEEEQKIQTGFRMQDQKEIGYVVSTIKDEDISEVTTTIDDAINTKVAGLEIPGKVELGSQVGGGIGAAKIRGSGTINMNTNALVVVDGVPMKRSENQANTPYRSESGSILGSSGAVNTNLDHIDPANIATITVLKGLAATNAWGSEGRGGVILITTKTASFKKGKNGKPVDRALLKNNVYKGDQAQMVSDKSPTLRALEQNANIEDAYTTYLTLQSLNGNDVKFFLEAFDYFKSKDKQKAGRIISNLLELRPDDVEVLRIVSKAFFSIEEYSNTVLVNQEIIKSTPSDVNAYLSRAKAKVGMGLYQEALNELLALDRGNTYFSVNAQGISKTLKREIKNLVSKFRDELNLSNVDSEYLKGVKYKVRLLFEWNIPGAEFELQFVNPQKRYFNWEHTNTALGGRIENELKDNYRVEEYEFYGDVEGEWVINAKYLGETKDVAKTPLVLKTTIYKDFGSPNQTKEDIVVHFSKLNEKKNLKHLLVN